MNSHEAGTLPNKPFQQRLELSQSVGRRIVTDRIGYYQPAVMNQGATAVDHIRDVTVALVIERLEERLTEAPDYPPRILAIKQCGADAIVAHGADTVGQDEPASLGFQGRAAITDLNILPGCLGLQQNLIVVPVMEVVRE